MQKQHHLKMTDLITRLNCQFNLGIGKVPESSNQPVSI